MRFQLNRKQASTIAFLPFQSFRKRFDLLLSVETEDNTSTRNAVKILDVLQKKSNWSKKLQSE